MNGFLLDGTIIRSIVLTAIGLAVGFGALLAFIYFRTKRYWHVTAWIGVTGAIYIVGRYAIYPQHIIPYTGLVAWFTAALLAIIVGSVGIVWKKG